jgi:16S rRNA (uracil1498-N3)-methyltransferase
MNIFYCPDAVLNELCVLDEAESAHLTKVLRKKENDQLYVFDGKGKLYDARIENIGKKETTIHVVRLIEVEEQNKPRLHIAIAPSKNTERLEWFAEKATEIGIAEITPLICKHSERKELRPDRIEKILLGASKQSMKLTIPRLNPVIKFEAFIKSVKADDRKFIAYCDEKSVHLKDAYHGGFDAVILIGPEGDFTREEVLLAEENEFETVSLGKSRLRLETAGIYAATVFNLANEK